MRRGQRGARACVLGASEGIGKGVSARGSGAESEGVERRAREWSGERGLRSAGCTCNAESGTKSSSVK